MKLPQFLAKKFLSKQLARPSGFLGKYMMGRFLDRTTSAHNALVLSQMDIQRTDRVLEIGFGGEIVPFPVEIGGAMLLWEYELSYILMC